MKQYVITKDTRYVGVDAKRVKVPGFPEGHHLCIHENINPQDRCKWVATHVESGRMFAKARTKEALRLRVNNLLEKKDKNKLKRDLKKHQQFFEEHKWDVKIVR